MPEVINTAQGNQFTSIVFTDFVLKDLEKVKLSMDGKGRATGNAFIESQWQSVKYEKLYLGPPKDGSDLCNQLYDYFD